MARRLTAGRDNTFPLFLSRFAEAVVRFDLRRTRCSTYFPRPRMAATLGLLALACSAGAQTARPTLREAVDAAWLLSPQARALASRQAELDARSRAAGAFLAGPPSVALAHKSGRGAASGAHETEGEISAPLWAPRLRSATAAQVDADRAALAAQAAAVQLKLASEARELSAAFAVAEFERDLATRKAGEAATLAADTERRVRAGDSARVDLLRAQAALREAQSAGANAEGAVSRALANWRALTGLAQPATLDAAQGREGEHPLVQAAQANVRAARAKLEVTDADRRDPVEVGVGFVRERPGGGVPTESAVKLSLRVPLGGDIRNGARVAAARAELDGAEAELDAARRAAASEREAAVGGTGRGPSRRTAGRERERFAREAQELIAQSHRLGESDLHQAARGRRTVRRRTGESPRRDRGAPRPFQIQPGQRGDAMNRTLLRPADGFAALATAVACAADLPGSRRRRPRPRRGAGRRRRPGQSALRPPTPTCSSWSAWSKGADDRLPRPLRHQRAGRRTRRSSSSRAAHKGVAAPQPDGTYVIKLDAARSPATSRSRFTVAGQARHRPAGRRAGHAKTRTRTARGRRLAPVAALGRVRGRRLGGSGAAPCCPPQIRAAGAPDGRVA